MKLISWKILRLHSQGPAFHKLSSLISRTSSADLQLGGEALDFLSTTTLWNDSISNGPRMELSIILMDLEMPVMDGLACTRRIRDLEREGKILGPVPIIAVTANTRMEQIEQALEAGMVIIWDPQYSSDAD